MTETIAPEPINRKLFAGARVRALRTARGLSQTRMAADLGVSISYLNLIERDQRPLSAAFLLKLAATYDLDLKSLAEGERSDLADELVKIFTDPRLIGIDVPRADLRDLAVRQPGIAQALVRLATTARTAQTDHNPLAHVRALIHSAGNHFPALDAAAETLADELRLSGGDLGAAVVERLRARHSISVRIMPVDVLPDALRRLDLHARQLQLSELLDAASRSFAAAIQLALIELKPQIAEAAGSIPGSRPDPLAQRAATHALAKYAAAAILMPYGRFLAACESTGYDVELLQSRFGRGLEQIAHRLTTLGRPGARGVPFFLIRIDRAGTVSKRFAPSQSGAANPLPTAGNCALWNLHAAFAAPGQMQRQLVELEDGHRFLTLARTIRPTAGPWGSRPPSFAIGIGTEARHAALLAWSAGLDLSGPAVPIGPGCAACHRADCRQRGLPPAAAHLAFDERERGHTPFRFTEE